jgi:hypothetical protein
MGFKMHFDFIQNRLDRALRIGRDVYVKETITQLKLAYIYSAFFHFGVPHFF